jgi:hypothetical protein
MIRPKKVGTVEILVTRVYPVDPRNHNSDRTEAIVPPGVFDLYRQIDAYFWVMRGEINLRGIHQLGHGIFLGNPADEGSGITIEFPSDYFCDVEFRDCLAWPEFIEGHPRQRVRVTIEDEKTKIDLYGG